MVSEDSHSFPMNERQADGFPMDSRVGARDPRWRAGFWSLIVTQFQGAFSDVSGLLGGFSRPFRRQDGSEHILSLGVGQFPKLGSFFMESARFYSEEGGKEYQESIGDVKIEESAQKIRVLFLCCGLLSPLVSRETVLNHMK